MGKSAKVLNFMKTVKITKFSTFSENVTDRSDTLKMTLFDCFFMKKCQFRHFPLALDRGLGQSCPLCPLVVSVGGPVVSKL